MEYSKLCESIFNLNSDIRYVAVIDDTGLPVVGGMRGGLDSIMDENNVLINYINFLQFTTN